MQNPYYHEFTPNIIGNVWFWFAIIIFVAAFILGWKQFYFGGKVHKPRHLKVIAEDGSTSEHLYDVPKIKARLGQRDVDVRLIVLGIIMMAMIGKGSGAGLIQWFDNRLMQNEDPVGSVVMTVIVVVITVAVMMNVWYMSFCFGAAFKKAKLKKIQEEIKNDEGVRVIDKRLPKTTIL